MQAPAVTATSVRRVPGPSRRRLTLRRRRQWLGVLFAAPAVLVITVFFLVPLGLTFYMSLNDWSLLGAHSWTGLDNYTRAFEDPGFRSAFWFTLEYTAVVTPLLFLLALGLALLVKRRRRGARFFQSIYFLPVVIGFASSSFLWLYMGQPGLGPLFDLLQRLHLVSADANWFADKQSALLLVVVSITWKVVGLQMLLLLAGLQSIPVELEEAARIDGAGRGAVSATSLCRSCARRWRSSSSSRSRDRCWPSTSSSS
jgi:multiple sugar transport system permease protein